MITKLQTSGKLQLRWKPVLPAECVSLFKAPICCIFSEIIFLLLSAQNTALLHVNAARAGEAGNIFASMNLCNVLTANNEKFVTEFLSLSCMEYKSLLP